MKYKVGDRVRIVSEWPRRSIANSNGLMDKWLGQIMTIRSCDHASQRYRMEEDFYDRTFNEFPRHKRGWLWDDTLIVGLAEECANEMDEAPTDALEEFFYYNDSSELRCVMTKSKVLFRGRQKDSDQWVRGRLIADDVIVPCGQEFRVLPNNVFDLDEELTLYVVDRETVGQHIGLDDENGEPIFEGDIVDVIDTYGVVLAKFRGVVVFTHASYAIDDGACIHYRWADYKVTVVGNVHDNPELITMEV